METHSRGQIMEEGNGGLTEKLPSHALGPLSVQSGRVPLQFPVPILGNASRERRSQVLLQNCVGVLPPSLLAAAAATASGS